MDFLIGVLQGAAVELVGRAVVSVPGVVTTKIKELIHSRRVYQIKQFLHKLGTTSPENIRALVQQELGKVKEISDRQREDVAAVLISLARGANMLTSRGDPQSVYKRAEDILGDLLDTLQPKRQAGEAVFPHSAWTLHRFLGMGAFGEVWLARNGRAPGLPKRAYKFFTHEGAADWLEREKERLLEVQNKLKDYPQIVRLTNVEPKQDPPYLELEYVDGGSLEDWITDADPARRPLRKGEVMRGIVRAVAAAHRQEVYHCDLKPANILLTEDGIPKITDFGLSSVHAPPEGQIEPVLAGTPMYWPPEAMQPLAERKPALYDVFALGVIWYQLLVERIERPPYDFAAEVRDRGEDSHTIQVLACCLAAPERRYKDAGELLEHMEQVDLPVWPPVPERLFDVSHLVREYVGLAAK